MSEVSTLLLAFSLLVLATTPPLLVVGRLTAAPQRDDAGVLSFVVVGDWGGSSSKPYYTGAEKDVAKQMGETATQIGSRFTVALGDNFYENGVKDVDDPRFSETFEVRTRLKAKIQGHARCFPAPDRQSSHAHLVNSTGGQSFQNCNLYRQ